MNTNIYRCRSDGKLVFEDEFNKHIGHKVDPACNSSLLEDCKILYKWYVSKVVKERKGHQA